MQMDNMAKKMLIDATHAEETRVVVADGNKVDEFDFESENKRQLAGNIYLAKVTRVEPSLQAAFVDYGGNRHGFLAYSEIHPDYYQIPVADREALIAEEQEYARQQAEEEDKPKKKTRSRGRSRSKTKAEEVKADDAVATDEAEATSGMDVVDLDADAPDEAQSPMETVAETPVETPAADEEIDDDAAEELEAADKDENIESVAQEDVTEEIRQPRKARPKRYKIQEVIKVRQVLLVQVVKEERGNKGAALTTYLSLAGRYCVLMPNTARGGGISRKITNAADRKKLKEIAGEIDVPQGAGLIVRTAGAKRTKTEIKRDYEYLQRQWEQVRELTLKSIAPTPIYEEGDLIKRSIRDLYNREIDEVLIEGEAGYRVAKDFMKMIMPSHAKNVKLYNDPMPLFARHQVESYLSGMFNPTVQLPSGGYIVIDTTEALVAVDVNSGRATKEGSIEQTALKTNLEAAEEVARQMRLRDLAGLIVIDFIDMEERRNNNAVEKKLKDKLKTDRARIQVGRISGFGLLEMSRQRLRPGMLEASTQPCPSCHGTGLIRSDDSLALTILRQLEEEGTRKRSREVLLKAPINVINYLMNAKREHVMQIELRYGMAVRMEADPHLVSPDFTIEKFKTATRVVRPVTTGVVSMDSIDMSDMDIEADDEEVIAADARDDEDQPPKKKRRRRRGGRGRSKSNRPPEGGVDASADGPNGTGPKGGNGSEGAQAEASEPEVVEAKSDEAVTEDKPKSRSRSRSRSKSKSGDAVVAEASSETDAVAEVDAKPEPKEKPKRASRAKKPAKAAEAEADAPELEAEAKPKPAKKPRKSSASKAKKDAEAKEAAPEAVEDAPAPKKTRTRVSKKPAADEAVEAPAPEATAKPKRKGWWSLGR
jgi:ribonuclease E